jgi:hypothetical protein
MLLGIASALAVAGQPDPGNSTGDERIGVSPKNLTVPPSFQHVYTYQLKDNTGAPVAGFPASQVELRFTQCTEPSSRPQNEIPADLDSDANGNVIWKDNLAFGGSDPCEVIVLVQNDEFFTVPGFATIPEGGLRSPDMTGDGLVALADLATWQQAFIGASPVYEGDIAAPYDDLVALSDLAWWQQHFTAP